jgi:hypothetical protein
MGGGGTEEGIGEGDFAVPDAVGELEERGWGIGKREEVGIDDEAPAAITEFGPGIEDAACGELAGAKYFVIPEEIALGIGHFGEEPIGEADGFDGFAVVDVADAEVGVDFEALEDDIGVDRVLRGVEREGTAFGDASEPG